MDLKKFIAEAEERGKHSTWKLPKEEEVHRKASPEFCEEFAEKLLIEEKVAVVPGSAFGQHGEGYIRCCYATSLPEIEEAIKRMGRFVGRHSRK